MGVFCVPKPLVGGFGCDELVLYGIRELAEQHSRPMRAEPRHSSTNESGEHWIRTTIVKHSKSSNNLCDAKKETGQDYESQDVTHSHQIVQTSV